MSNNNAATTCNGEHLKQTTAATSAAAAATKTKAIKTTENVDGKLLAVAECASNGIAANVNSGACDTPAVGGFGDGGDDEEDELCKGAAACSACTNLASEACCVGEADNGAVAGAASWLAMQMYATNNNLINATAAAQLQGTAQLSQQQVAINKWWMDANGIVHKYNSACQLNDKGGGELAGGEQDAGMQLNLTGALSSQHSLENMQPVDLDYEYAMAAAAILTPTEHNTHSNRTSLNNSTENLSYNSDNYYADDIILLDDDIDAEEVSLNSDDCIYAYRGDGDELEFAVLNAKNVKPSEDETDFLEMDFEPDPLSELEYGDGDGGVGIFDNDGAANSARNGEPIKSHANALLLQRNSCHISSSSSNGRHSANMELQMPAQLGHATAMPDLQCAPHKRQLYSSPTDELNTQTNCLQTQAMLSKNFARISLHLDQINGDISDNMHIAQAKEHLSVTAGDRLHGDCMLEATARSLPSTLNAYIARDAPPEHSNAAAKDTGAKPKRLSRFSSTSSTCSKASNKSRSSLRAALTPAICASVSFDERSVSCNDFRSTPPAGDDAQLVNGAIDVANFSEDTCLDCLENEFLASTIGKVLETNKCLKCHKRRQTMCFYARLSAEPRCRSGSPSYLNDYGELLFDEFSASASKQWIVPPTRALNKTSNGCVEAEQLCGYNLPNDGHLHLHEIKLCMEGSMINQRRKQQRDSYKAEQQLAKAHALTEPEIKIATVDLTEAMLVQALDKLHVSYSSDLIRAHFAAHARVKTFKNLLEFLMHESTKNCNHAKLKRLIELATKKQITVCFKEDANRAQPEMVNVKVADILQQWTHNKNLALLQHLDKRFMDANIMGKIANIIRQAQQQARAPTTRRPPADYLKIPQYYPSGHLILQKRKKCQLLDA